MRGVRTAGAVEAVEEKDVYLTGLVHGRPAVAMCNIKRVMTKTIAM